VKFQLSIQTQTTTGIGTLRKATKNSQGFYEGVPLAVLGAVSRNNYYYDPKSLVDAMGNKNTRFYKALVGGGLDGEWGHPDVTALTDRKAIERMCDVVEQNVSHYFNRIWIDTLENGTQIVRGDVKPRGVYAPQLEESFQDENHDAAFSLRSITSDPVRRADGAYAKKVLALITYDGVSLPGYEIASKRAMIGNESLAMLFQDDMTRIMKTDVADSTDVYDTIGYENFQCQQVRDILESDTLSTIVEGKALGIFDSATGVFTGVDGKRRPVSTLHGILGGGR
jgi:hypothetical protein